MSQGKNKTILTVSSDMAGKRLDICLAQLPFRISRSRWKRLIEGGFVKMGGHSSTPSHILKTGEVIEINIPEPEPLEIEPEKIVLDIVYEDDSLLIINKPAGMVVHPGAGHSKHTLVNALLYHCPDLAGIGGKKRPGIVHRLDKDTSGLLAVAKTEWAHISLSSQLKKKQVQRVYLALVHGTFSEDEGKIHTLIGRHPVYRQKMSINVRTGRDAITNWKVKERFSYFTLMELILQTGRTHQIRVHMSHLSHPVVGDKVYGRGKIPQDCPLKLKSAIDDLPGQALHAYSLGFHHPISGKHMEFFSSPPMSIQKILNILKGT